MFEDIVDRFGSFSFRHALNIIILMMTLHIDFVLIPISQPNKAESLGYLSCNGFVTELTN